VTIKIVITDVNLRARTVKKKPRKVHLFKKADMGSLNKDIEQDPTRYIEDKNIENKTTEDLPLVGSVTICIKALLFAISTDFELIAWFVSQSIDDRLKSPLKIIFGSLPLLDIVMASMTSRNE
jgi:hypothetical protein